MQTYPVGERNVIESAPHQYPDDTSLEQVVGIRVEFVDAPSCGGRVMEDYLPVTYSGTECAVGSDPATKFPTRFPTQVSPGIFEALATSQNEHSLTLFPLLQPPTTTPTTARPTKAPSAKPTTSSPTRIPTGTPTARPTALRPATAEPATSSPAAFWAGTTAPTPVSTLVSDARPTGTPSVITPMPTDTSAAITTKPTTSSASITTKPATSSPTGRPTAAKSTKSPTIKKLGFDETVRAYMTLYHSEVMDPEAQAMWIETTEETVLKETLMIVKDRAAELGYYPEGYRGSNVEVTVTVIQQLPGELVRRRGLQGSGDAEVKLNIIYDTRIVIPVPAAAYFFGGGEAASEAAEDMAYSAFRTKGERDRYASELRAVGAESGDFQVVRTVEVIDSRGEAVTGPGGGDPNGIIGGGDGGETGGASAGLIAGISVAAAVVLIGGGLAVGRKRIAGRRDASSDEVNSDLPAKKGSLTSGSDQRQQDTLSGGTGSSTARHASQAQQSAATQLTLNESTERSGFYGVIEPDARDDDVSTLGDPYMGDATGSSAMDGDGHTVGASTARSEGEYYSNNGGTIGLPSIAGSESLTSRRLLLFGDDPTIEDAFETPPDPAAMARSPSGMSGGRGTVIKVDAPPGMLGIVLDSPNGDVPKVYAIKGTSPLHGKVRVDDLLLRVDEVDCRGMTTHQVSALLNARGGNPARRLVLLRQGGGGGDTVAV